MSFETGAYQNAVAMMNPAGAPHPAPGDSTFPVRVRPAEAVFLIKLTDSCGIPNALVIEFGGQPHSYGVQSTRFLKNKKRTVSLMPKPGSPPDALPTPLFIIKLYGVWSRYFRIYNATTSECVVTVMTRDPSKTDSSDRTIRSQSYGWFGDNTSVAPFFSVDGDAWSSGCRVVGAPHREPLFTLSKQGYANQYGLLVEAHLDSALMLACAIGLLDLYGPSSARLF